MTNQQIDNFSQSYLRLVLELDKHIEGYVDSYYGPNFIKEEVDSGPILSPVELKKAHEQVVDALPREDPDRYRYLKAITNAIGCTLEKINGKAFEYTDEVYQLFGIMPKPVDENEFLSAKSILESHIP